MPPYPTFNGENNKQAWGGDREIDRHAALITQPKEAHFTGSVLYAHLCLWNCNRLFQLHARLDHGVVTIDVLLGVNLCKNHSSCKWCKKLIFPDYFYFFLKIISHCSLKHFSNTASALGYDAKYKNTPDNKALVFILTVIWTLALANEHKKKIIGKKLKLGFSVWWPGSFPMTVKGVRWSEKTMESNPYFSTLKQAT